MRDLLFFKRGNHIFEMDKLCIRFHPSEITKELSVEWVKLLNELAARFGRKMKISMDWTDLPHSPFDIREVPLNQRQLEIIKTVNHSHFKWILNSALKYNLVVQIRNLKLKIGNNSNYEDFENVFRKVQVTNRLVIHWL